jgi:KaiC/GvpD/RAD55 family RecA-like ATPase
LNPFLTAALEYHAMGLHPIPCRPKNKIPLVNWKEFQATQPTSEQIAAWWAQTPDANVALVLGRGTFAVDLDGGLDALTLLTQKDVYLPDEAPRSKTGGGYHVFFRSHVPVPDRVGLVSTNGGKPQVDIRGVGIVVAPPSIHPNGATYTWEVPITTQLPTAPLALTDLIHSTATASAPVASTAPPHGDSWVSDALRGVGEGMRDAVCTRLAGYFLGRGLEPDVVAAVLTDSFARNCKPTFSAMDVRKCVQSIARRERVVDDGDGQGTRPEHISEVLARNEEQRKKGALPSLATPYRTLNKMLAGGFSPGELIYVGARPGVGKSALALECARVAGKDGIATLIISREMTTAALARRMTAQEGRVSATAIRLANLTPDQERNYKQALRILAELPIWLTDRAVSIGAILSAVENTPRKVGLLVVDYLQLVRAPKGITDRRLQVEEVSKALKTFALEMQIPVLCLSSLSRPAKTATGTEPKPTMADLRESGELEHDADIILLLHRAFQSNEATCIVAKSREGATGECPLMFSPEFVSFSALAEDYHQ